jgi:hypothetical protein
LIDFDMGLNPESTLGMLVALPCAKPGLQVSFRKNLNMASISLQYTRFYFQVQP